MSDYFYVLKPTAGRSKFVVPCTAAHSVILDLFISAYKQRAFLNKELKAKLFGDTGYRYFVSDGDFFLGDFIAINDKTGAVGPGRFERVAKVIRGVWPQFERLEAADHMTLPMNEKDRAPEYERARKQFATEYGLNDDDWQIAFDTLRNICLEQRPIYELEYGAKRGQTRRARVDIPVPAAQLPASNPTDMQAIIAETVKATTAQMMQMIPAMITAAVQAMAAQQQSAPIVPSSMRRLDPDDEAADFADRMDPLPEPGSPEFVARMRAVMQAKKLASVTGAV